MLVGAAGPGSVVVLSRAQLSIMRRAQYGISFHVGLSGHSEMWLILQRSVLSTTELFFFLFFFLTHKETSKQFHAKKKKKKNKMWTLKRHFCVGHNAPSSLFDAIICPLYRVFSSRCRGALPFGAFSLSLNDTKTYCCALHRPSYIVSGTLCKVSAGNRLK